MQASKGGRKAGDALVTSSDEGGSRRGKQANKQRRQPAGESPHLRQHCNLMHAASGRPECSEEATLALLVHNELDSALSVWNITAAAMSVCGCRCLLLVSPVTTSDQVQGHHHFFHLCISVLSCHDSNGKHAMAADQSICLQEVANSRARAKWMATHPPQSTPGREKGASMATLMLRKL